MLVRLNADLQQLRTSAPEAFEHFVDRWRKLVRGFPQSARRSASNVRGWRVEVLTAAELAANGVAFTIGDPNPRVQQGQPDLIIDSEGVQLAIECGSVEPDGDGDLADRVFSAAWDKAFDRRTKSLRGYVGPDALLVLDITSVAARHAAAMGGTADFDLFARSVVRSLDRRSRRHGADWGAILLHFVGIYSERAHPEVRNLRLRRPAWAVSTRGSSAVLTKASEPLEIVNRSFFAMIGHFPSGELDDLMAKCFPMARGRVTAHLEHLPWSIVY